MGKNPKLAGYVAITFAMLFWGMSFVWTKHLLNAGFPVFTIVFLRLVIASIIFVTLFKLQHKLEKIQKGDWKIYQLQGSYSEIGKAKAPGEYILAKQTVMVDWVREAPKTKAKTKGKAKP